MTIECRFKVWVFLVASILIVSPVWFAAYSSARDGSMSGIGAMVVTSLIAAVALLIITTPPSAIRLPPLRSVLWITAGTLWLVLSEVALLDPLASTVAGLVVLTMAAASFAFALQRIGGTPWWAVVVAWNPASIGPAARYTWPVAVGMFLAAAITGAIAAVGCRRV